MNEKEKVEMEEKKEHSLQTEADKAKPRRTASVVTYIAILFAVAFALLLLSYFMQQRNTSQVIEGLQSSVNAVENLQNTNAALYQQVETLKTQLKEQESNYTELQSNMAAAQTLAANQKKAMDLFWQIERTYLLKQYTLCRQAVTQMEGGGLAQYLPAENTHAILARSPAQEYARIKKALG